MSAADRSETALTLDKVAVSYGATVVVNELTVTVPRGQWVAAIGANGAGKTSLLRAIAYLISSAGTISVDGRPLDGLSTRRRAQLVAYVPQQPEFPAQMSVMDYTLLGRTPYVSLFGTESTHDRMQCRLVLTRLGLDGLADRRLSTLSGGELQRVVLARALAQEAPVLLLDEPTSALDLGRRIDVLELVDELRQERSLTVLSAMHDLTLAAQFADRLLLLSNGNLIADGPPAEVLDEATLSACFGTHVRVLTGADGELLVLPQRHRQRSSPAMAGTARAGSHGIGGRGDG